MILELLADLPLGVLTCVVAIFLLALLIIIRKLSQLEPVGNLPPLAPKPWRENARNLAAIEGATSIWYLKDLSESFHCKLKSEGKIAESGVLFRIAMPQRAPFIVCTDYKVARVILEGDSDGNVKESEKIPLVRQFDSYPGRPTIFS